MVYATLEEVIEQDKDTYFKLIENGTSKEGIYSEESVYKAIKLGLIQIKYLRASDEYGKVIIESGFCIRNVRCLMDLEAKEEKKEAKKKQSRKKPTKRKPTLETLRKQIATLEKQMEKTTDSSKRADIRDKIIIKRREICKLQNIETSNVNNIYSHVHKTKRKGKVVQVG